LIDNNQNNIEKAKNLGLEAFVANIYSDTLTDNIELNDVGYLMALTGNSDINAYAIKTFKKEFGEHGSFRLVNTDEMNDPDNNPKEGLFSHTDDFIALTEAARANPMIHEIDLKSKEHYKALIEITKADNDIVPLFFKGLNGDLKIISSFSTELEDVEEGSQLVYLGKKLDADKESKKEEAASVKENS
jgi:hypothetical protein